MNDTKTRRAHGRRLAVTLAQAGLALAALPGFASAQTVYRQSDNLSQDSYDPSRAGQRPNNMQAGRAAADQVSARAPDSSAGYQSAVIEDDSRRQYDGAEAVTRSTSSDNAGADDRSTNDQTRTRNRRPVPPGEFEQFVSKMADKPIRRFGSSLLVPEGRDFAPGPVSSVPDDYYLNPGDQLVVGLTGSVEGSNLRLTIDRDGRIFIPRIGAVVVGGLRYGEVQSVIARAVARYYRAFDVSVTMGRLHGITVYVTGFAATPGSYSVSSLSTLVNAVLAAGGPSAGGSFRSIQLRRNGKLVSDFDLYDLLLKGDKSGDAFLQSGDVIHIAPAGAQVAVIGSVNQEAVFEAAPKDTLNDILLYAGGLNTVADDRRLLVLDSLRTAATGWEELTPEAVQQRIAKRGEVLRVLSGVGIANALDQQPVLVTISGEVERPGRYYLQPGATIGDLLVRAGHFSGDAFPFATVFTRQSVKAQQRISYTRAIDDVEMALTTQPLVSAHSTDKPDMTQAALISSVVGQLRAREPDGRLVLDIPVSATSLPGEMVLENNDSIYVPPRPITVGVFGAVPSPASFKHVAGMTIAQYIKRAGGVQKIGARSDIFVVRANGMVLSRSSDHGGALSAKAVPGDLVFVPVNTRRGEVWQKIRDISQVLFSGALAGATIYGVTK